ncbi:MAG: polysaccharide deacetylase family protein [Desulfosporosinus sp.]|nr:polysaccharide deacetylase family protein [Desulfosporosinus sp.]
MKKKHAVLSMDIEDWYHLDYFAGKELDKSRSMLDGLTKYIELLNRNNIKTTFFTLSELADSAKEQILYANQSGHEIACHGKSHLRPLQMDLRTFAKEISEAKETLSELIGKEVIGYRAPCYSIDRKRFDLVIKAGFKYDSSMITFNEHPLYGKLDLSDFEQQVKGIYHKNGFYEFELSTKMFMGRNMPVSGGGYIRILPWLFMKPMISRYLKNAEVYVLYIHPFELSDAKMPNVNDTSLLTNIRARKGLYKMEAKLNMLIGMLKANNFEIKTFSQLINDI